MDLSALASFNLVASHGGFGAAARATGRPKATLSRHVTELEQQLGVRLVERGAVLRLTEEGRQLHIHTAGPMNEISEIGSAISGGTATPRGLLRISAPQVLAQTHLTRIGIRFCALHPAVLLELVADDRFADPVADGFDMVIRVNPASDERLVGRQVASDRLLVVAAPSIVQPTERDATVPGVLLSRAATNQRWRYASTDGVPRTVLPEARMLLSSLLMVREAALAGLGVARLPALLAQPDIEAGQLRCWGVLDGPPVAIWALHPSRRLTSARVKAFMALLLEELGG